MKETNLLLIDGIGPFFRHYKKQRINWSKIPFCSLETSDGLRADVVADVPGDFRTFCRQARTLGYNAVTLDDVAHLLPCDAYSPELSRKIEAYRELFRALLTIAGEVGLKVFFTMDIMFYNEALESRLGNSWQSAAGWLRAAFERLFVDFPTIGGVIMRFGESDGVDVSGEFRSRLLLKRPSQVRGFLRRLLPVFEKHHRKLIFRTWSVGAYQIGDLIWNKQRFQRTFNDLDSPSLIISLKYGESDFFRYLPLNELFFAGNHQKLIEFQARREYEGFGAYPSFIGWDTEEYLRDLQTAKNVVGMSVWCQTGGWGKRRQLTFVRNSSIWVELNTCVLAMLWKGATCDEAISNFTRDRLPHVPVEKMIQFLRLSDVVIKELLYVREFAEQRLFFRRLRVPPQFFVYWDRIMIDHTIKRLLGCFVQDGETAIAEGQAALARLREMIALAEQVGIPTKGLTLQLHTFEILAVAREYLFRPYDEAIATRLTELKRAYKYRFKRRYSVMLNFNEAPLRRSHLRVVLPILLRERGRYRMLDQVVTIRLLSWLLPVARMFRVRLGPKFAHEQAMGIESLLK